MAFEETIIWTALPNGVGSDPGGSPVLQLSVHVSPRLTTSGGSDTTLASFPDFGDWPGHTQSFSVTVQIVSGPGSGTYTQTSTITPDPRRSDVWQALFPSTTLVRSQHDVDTFKGVPIVSYSPLNVLDYLRQHYVDTALQSPNEHPAFSDITGWLDPLGFGDREGAARLKNALSALATERNGARANSFANADPQRDFVALREFHRPRSVARVPAAKPDLDFHQAISLAGEHPKLQRLLGLVFDLQVPVAGLPLSGTPAHAKVSVTPSFPAAGASGYKPVSPKTLALLGSSTFEAEPAGP
ncbi:MAG: hypothetical protein QOG63_2737, partial [Thermoleophilaceae bacterium]|nr:hypothetical protein [Thermoleophilaceae bacterium]